MASSLSPVGFPQQQFMPPSDYPPSFPEELWSRPPELSPLGSLPPFPIRQPLPPFAAHDLDILEHPFSAPVLSMDMADDACLKEIVGKLPTSLPLPMSLDPPRLHGANMVQSVGNWITPTGTQGAQNNAGLAQSSAGFTSLANFSADPGFIERAAKFSSFVSQQGTDMHNQTDIKGRSRLPIERMTNSWMRTPPVAMDFSPREHSAEAKTDQSGITSRSRTPTSMSGPGPQKDCTSSSDHTFRTQAQEGSTTCDQGGSSLASNALTRVPTTCKKKRVASKTEGAKDIDMDEVSAKRSKSGDCAMDAVEKVPKPQHSGATSGNSDASTQKTSKESAKVSDVEQPPKPDYVHVRARRGQATDSHSLAERVRREKISERMKYLQDLVPGCSKVTGKAVMLDEIINYVQSLQRQVEFLSMKLAAVYPARMDISLETLLGKEDIIPQKPLVSKAMDVSFAADNNSSYSLMQYQRLLAPQLQEPISCSAPVDVHPFPAATDALSQTFSGLASMDTYGDCISQVSQTWEDELQNAIHRSFAQQTPLTSSSLQGPLISGQMKVEL